MDTQNKKETADISWTHNEKKGLGKLNTHISWAREIGEDSKQPTRRACVNLSCGTRICGNFWRNSAKGYKG